MLVIASTAALGPGIDAIGRLQQADDAGREVDDAPALAQTLGRLAQGVECALEVDVDQALESRVVIVGDGREQHDTGIVDEHVDTAERSFRGVEPSVR
jgi:hypothetical protein